MMTQTAKLVLHTAQLFNIYQPVLSHLSITQSHIVVVTEQLAHQTNSPGLCWINGHKTCSL